MGTQHRTCTITSASLTSRDATLKLQLHLQAPLFLIHLHYIVSTLRFTESHR